MEKEKRERIILFVLLPIFIIGLIIRVTEKSRMRRQPKPEKAITPTAEEAIKVIESKIGPVFKRKSIVYEGENYLDPLKDKLVAYLSSISKEKKKEVAAIKPPKLKIYGLIWNTDRPQAIINDQLLSVGDEIEGARILLIDKDGIKVEYKGMEFFIPKG